MKVNLYLLLCVVLSMALIFTVWVGLMMQSSWFSDMEDLKCYESGECRVESQSEEEFQCAEWEIKRVCEKCGLGSCEVGGKETVCVKWKVVE